MAMEAVIATGGDDSPSRPSCVHAWMCSHKSLLATQAGPN